MLKKIKIVIWLNKMYNRFMKIKLIKHLNGIITIILGYSVIRYLLYFNKFIIYLFGLLFVGVSWSDYHIFKEIKLIYDSLILYILKFLPDNEMTNEIQDTTKSDIKEIIYKDHTNVNNEIDKDYVYVIADKLNEVKSIRSEIKETIISDGKDNEWTLSDILTKPWIIFTIATAITISSALIIHHYDIKWIK